MQETLTCTSCKSKWTRQRARGRKPVLCPQCLSQTELEANQTVLQPVPTSSAKSVYTQKSEPISTSSSRPSLSTIFSGLFPRYQNAEELAESTKNGSVWKCPSCSHILKMNVAVTAPVTHRCTPDTVTTKICERIK